MDIELEKKEFLHREFCASSFMASFGIARRIRFYQEGVDREPIKEFFRTKLSDLLGQYSKKVDYENHTNYIEEFKKSVDGSKHSHLLEGGAITFGRAQKLINLYLKYAWVSGWLKREQPPHCPIDSKVIEKLEELGEKTDDFSPWTRMTKEGYIKAVQALENVKGKISIAGWELHAFNKIIAGGEN